MAGMDVPVGERSNTGRGRSEVACLQKRLAAHPHPGQLVAPRRDAQPRARHALPSLDLSATRRALAGMAMDAPEK